jgi:hypothetical protein
MYTRLWKLCFPRCYDFQEHSNILSGSSRQGMNGPGVFETGGIGSRLDMSKPEVDIRAGFVGMRKDWEMEVWKRPLSNGPGPAFVLSLRFVRQRGSWIIVANAMICKRNWSL